MKITFLGTGAATAMPLPFCNCETCKYGREVKGKEIRKRSSIMVNEDLLIDLGPDVVSSCMEYDKDLTRVQYILQTHAHSDHFDAGHLITRHKDYAVEKISPIQLVASYGTLVAMNKALKREDPEIDLFNEVGNKILSLTLKTIAHKEQKVMGAYKITAFDSLHDPSQEALIYLIEYEGKNLLYATDILEISEEMYDALKNRAIDLIVLDQTYGEGYNAGGHLDAGQIKRIIKRMKQLKIVTENTLIYGTHISHEGNGTHEVMEALANQEGYRIAYDGCIVEV